MSEVETALINYGLYNVYIYKAVQFVQFSVKAMPETLCICPEHGVFAFGCNCDPCLYIFSREEITGCMDADKFYFVGFDLFDDLNKLMG